MVKHPGASKPHIGPIYRSEDIALKPKAKLGRPSSYTPAKAQLICYLLQEGNGLAKACEIAKLEYRTVVRWLNEREDFRQSYAQARQTQADYYADSILEVIDNAASTRDEIERAKIKAEALKWIASKLKPRQYGDKLDLTSDGQRIERPIYGGLSVNASRPEPIEADVVKPKSLTDTAKP